MPQTTVSEPSGDFDQLIGFALRFPYTSRKVLPSNYFQRLCGLNRGAVISRGSKTRNNYQQTVASRNLEMCNISLHKP
jgi:hypothetical protein